MSDREDKGSFLGELRRMARTSGAVGGIAARVQHVVQVAAHEAIDVEVALLQPQARISPLQLPGAVAAHAMAQDQILRARRRPDRIGLDEPHRGQRAGQRRGCGEGSRQRMAAQGREPVPIRHKPPSPFRVRPRPGALHAARRAP